VKKIIMLLILMGQSLWAYAEQPLTQDLLESYVDVTRKMAELETRYPQVMDKSDQFSISEDRPLINFLKSSAAYPDIKRILASSRFKSLDNYFSISQRIMGGMYAEHQKQMKQQTGITDMSAMMEQGLLAMKQSGAPADVIADMKREMEKERTEVKEMEKLARNTSEQDKKFIRNKMNWLMQNLPEDEQ